MLRSHLIASQSGVLPINQSGVHLMQPKLHRRVRMATRRLARPTNAGSPGVLSSRITGTRGMDGGLMDEQRVISPNSLKLPPGVEPLRIINVREHLHAPLDTAVIGSPATGRRFF